MVIQITVSDTRSVEQKKQLFRRIADHLAESPGLRREDIFINLLEVKKENWSFGKGWRSTLSLPPVIPASMI